MKRVASFTPKKVTGNGPYDAIIIGSGISGLTCASLLVKAGWKVLVLERHDKPGGTMHTFQLGNKEGQQWEFDSGVHYIGAQLIESNVFRTMTERNIQWCKMDHLFERCKIESTQIEPTAKALSSAASGHGEVATPYDHSSSRNENIRKLGELFPEKKEAIRRFFKTCDWAASAGELPVYLLKLLPMWIAKGLEIPLGWLYGGTWGSSAGLSVAEMLEECGIPSNSALAGMLTYQWPDLGLPPKQQPFLVYARKVTGHGKGAYYPKGGGSVLVRAMVNAVLNSGRATVMVKAPVQRLILEGSSVCGIIVKGQEVRAPVVISAAGAYNTLIRMLPIDLPPAIKSNRDFHELRASLLEGGKGAVGQRSLPLSRTWISLFVGFDVPSSEVGIPKCNQWVFPSWDHDRNVDKCAEGADAEFPAIFMTSSSAKDDFWDERGAGNKGCICILAVVEYEWFAKFTAHEKNQKVYGNGNNQSGERTVQMAGDPIVPLQAHSVPKSSGEDLEKGYNELKDKLKARLLRTLTDQYPKVKGHIALSDLSTPLTVNRYLGATRGEFNGLEHGHNRFLAQVQRTLRPKTPIRGLYLTGQDVTQQGLFSAMKAGVMTVFAVSKLAFILFLPDLIKDRFFM